MSEHDEQAALFQWAATMFNQIPGIEMLFAIPNGGHRHKIVAKKLRAEGVKSGVPDMMLAWPANGYHGLFIEMKHGKNTTTDNQRKWIEALKEAGYRVEVCWGWVDAVTVIEDYLELTT